MSPTDKDQIIKLLKDAFFEACQGAKEGWSEAQAGHGYDCDEQRDSYLVPAKEKFSQAIVLLEKAS